MNARRCWHTLGVGFLVLLVSGGCGDDDDGSGASGGAAGTGTTTAGTGGGGSGPGGAGGSGAEAAPTVTVTFTGSDELFANPERGFHRDVDIVTGTDFTWVAEAGLSLARTYVRLDDYRNSSLPDSLLTAMGVGFAAARAAGIKLVPRFAYNFGFEDDAPLARVLEHIGQVAPVLQANADVIAVMHAGFVGAWGEWHSSTNELTSTENSRQIAEALLDALPDSRMIQIRTPGAKEAMWGPALTAAEAFGGSYKARAGHHNDCFLCNETDAGTYPSNDIEAYKDFVAQETLYTPMGGETCQVNEGNQRGDCPTTLAELERLHWSYLNLSFFEPAIDQWRTEGCFDTIDRRLGYRLRLVEADVPPAVRPGGQFVLRVALHNDGFAALYNPRPVLVVLDDGANRYEVALDAVDARRWAAGEDSSFTTRLELPSAMPEGDYQLALWLPDEVAALRTNPAYSIRFANDAGWDTVTGYQVLGSVAVLDTAPGTSNAEATAFTVLGER